jgi:outer membrane protein insertion porin family
VTFIVKEKPLIREIKYVGNKSFTESNILDHFKERKVGLTIDSQYDPAKIRQAERALIDLLAMNGKPLGTVHTEVDPIPPSSVRVRFVMDEGPKVRIGEIRFIGAKVFQDDELRGALKLVKERGLITIFKGTDKYHEGKLEYDIESNLKTFYKEHGYMQVQVGEPVTRIFEGSRGPIPGFRKTKMQFLIEIPVDAGDQYRLGELTLKDCGIFKCEALVKMFGLEKGDVVNGKKIKDGLENIKKLYGDWGYIDWSYLPDQKFNPEKKTMDLTFEFQPSKQFFVHRINFVGNTKTRDKVLRREFVLEEGKMFSSRALDVSVLRLNQLGYFDKIEEKDYEVKPDEKTGLVDVNVKVKEKSQQSIGFSGGVSGISGSFIGVNYTTNNLMGRGETLEFSVTAGTRESDFVISFTEPYLLDTRWNMGVSLFNQRFRFDTYTTFGVLGYATGQPYELFTRRTSGVTLSVSRPLGLSFWRFGASYTYQNISVGDISPGFEAYALGQLVGYIPGGDPQKALTGIIRSELTPTISYNSTNAYWNPTRGSSLSLSVGVAGGVFGGEFNLVRPMVEFRHFRPDRWISKGRNTLGFRLLAEYACAYGGSTLPFFDRFYVGGETTVRGFDIRSISPLAVSSTPQFDPNGNPIIDLNNGLAKIDRSIVPVGGDSLGIFNFEYRIPIAGPLSVAGFTDVGFSHVFSKSSLGDFGTTKIDIIPATNSTPRASVGAEVQFMLPMIGAPFRLIFAYNPLVFDEVFYVGNRSLHAQEPRRDIKFTIGRSF